jgi:hypothetical protein
MSNTVDEHPVYSVVKDSSIDDSSSKDLSIAESVRELLGLLLIPDLGELVTAYAGKKVGVYNVSILSDFCRIEGACVHNHFPERIFRKYPNPFWEVVGMHTLDMYGKIIDDTVSSSLLVRNDFQRAWLHTIEITHVEKNNFYPRCTNCDDDRHTQSIAFRQETIDAKTALATHTWRRTHH